MSDVSGIPYMGPMGQGNFFAPSFSYQPQMSAGQIQSNYMPEASQGQAVLNNLYGGGPNAGFGQLTNYYAQQVANSYGNINASYGGRLPPAGTFSDYNAGGDWPSRGGGGGGGASPYHTTPNVWDTGASPFLGGGGSSGMGGSIYGGSGINWGNVGQLAGGLQMPSQSPFDFGAGLGAGMFGGMGGTGATPGAGRLDWTHLFDGGGGGGARADPYPGMSMPGGLNAPMTMPQQQPTDFGSLFGRSVGGTGGAPQSAADRYAPAPMPSAGNLGAGMFGGLAGGIGGADQGPGSSVDWTRLFTGGDSTPQQPSSVFDTGIAPITGTQDTGPYGGGAGIGGLDTGRAIGAPYTQAVEPQRGGLQEPVTEAYNPYYGVTSPYGQGAGDQAAGAPTDTRTGALTPGGGLTATDLSEQAKTRLAELMNGAPKELSPDEVFAGDKPVPTEGQPALPDEVTDKTSGQEGLDAGERVPLPRERPEAADTTPNAGGELTARPDRPGVTLAGVNKKFAQAMKEFSREYHSTQGDYTMELRSGLRTGPKERLHRDTGRGGTAVDITLRDSKTGQLMPDYQTRDPKVFKAYQDNANQFHQFLEKNYPDLAAQHRWGGYFWDGGPGKYGSQDIMHHDLGAHIGMAAGSWRSGLGAMSAQAYGLPVGGGLAGGPPRPPADIPYPQGIPLPTSRPEAAGPGAEVFAQPPSAETPATQIYPGADVPRPPADVPSSGLFPEGVPLPAARPNAAANLSQAHSLLDTNVMDLVRKNSPSSASMVPSSIASQSLREALGNTFTGGMIRSGITSEQLAKAGITQADFDKAYAQGRVSPPRFGGEFGGMGGELPSPGAFTPFEGFRQSHPDFENRAADPRDELAALLQPPGGAWQAELGPEASVPLNIAERLATLNEGAASTTAPPRTAAEEFTPTRSITERAPSPAAEEMQRRYGGVGNADIGPPQYSGFEQPYGPQLAPGAYTREQFENRADYTAQDQAERLAGQRMATGGAQLERDPVLMRRLVDTITAEVGSGSSDQVKAALVESLLNRQNIRLSGGPRTNTLDPSGSGLRFDDLNRLGLLSTGSRGPYASYYEPFHSSNRHPIPPINAAHEEVERNPDYATHVQEIIKDVIHGGTNVSNLGSENASDIRGNPMGTNARREQFPGWFGPGPNETFARYENPRAAHEAPSAAVAQAAQNWARALQPQGYVDPLTREQRWQSIVNNPYGRR